MIFPQSSQAFAKSAFSMVFSVIILMPAAPTEVVTTRALVYTSHEELSTSEYCSLLISHTPTVLPIESIFLNCGHFSHHFQKSQLIIVKIKFLLIDWGFF